MFFFYLYSIRLISFIIEVPRPFRNETLDHSISQVRCVKCKLSQSVLNIFRDSRENIFSYYSQNIRLKSIHVEYYTCCLNLSSVGKRLKKSMQQVLELRQSRYLLNIYDYLKNMSKAQKFNSHIVRTVNVLGEDPTKITITNASIDKQITLKRVYIYKIENMNLKIGVSGV